MACAENACVAVEAVANDMVNYVHNFTQEIKVSYWYALSTQICSILHYR